MNGHQVKKIEGDWRPQVRLSKSLSQTNSQVIHQIKSICFHWQIHVHCASTIKKALISEESFLHIRCKRPSTNERGRRRRSNLRSQLMNNPLQTPSCHTDWIMDWPIDVITSGPAKTSPTERGKESPRCVWLPPGRVIPSFWTSSPPLPSSASPCSSPSTKSPIGELQMQTSRPADNSNLWPSPARRFLYNCPPVAAPHCVYICVMETHEYLYTWAAWEQRLTLCPIKYKYEGKYKYKYMNIYTGRPPENNVCIMPQQVQIQKPTCVVRFWDIWPKIWKKGKSLKRWARARAPQSHC